METGSLRRPGRGGARSNGARGGDVPEPAAHAELAANGVFQCASGKVLQFTAAAWEKRETTVW